MPTLITVPVGERVKSVQFGAAYSPSLTFNPDKKLFFNCSGVLFGMDITVDTGPTPDEVTVDPGAFIQNGIIVNISNSQLVQVPEPTTFPLFLVAENANEIFNSTVTIQFTTSPNADSAIIAEWPVGPITSPQIPLDLSVCSLRDEIELINKLVIQRDRQVATAGQTIFTLPAEKAYVLGANKIWVFQNGDKKEVNVDYTETDPTTITLTSGATVSDILEFVIFKSEPPITSIALNDLTDVISDLANAIKDTGANRVNPATQSNFLATVDDVTAAVVALLTQDEGSGVETNTSTLNFIGAGVTATSGGPGIVDVTVPALVSANSVSFDKIKKTLLLDASIPISVVGDIFLTIETVAGSSLDAFYFVDVSSSTLGSTPDIEVVGTVLHRSGGGVTSKDVRLDVINPGASAPNTIRIRAFRFELT